MAPFVKLLAGSSLLAGLVAAVTSRLARRRKRKAPPDEPANSSELDPPADNAPQQTACSTSDSGSASSLQALVPFASGASTPAPFWGPVGWKQRTLTVTRTHRPVSSASQRIPYTPHPHSGAFAAASATAAAAQPHHHHHEQHSYHQAAAAITADRYRRSSESQGTVALGPGGALSSSSGAGLLSRLLLGSGGRSESLEGSAISCSGDTVGSSTHGGGHGGMEEYDSSEEHDMSEGGAESSRSGYGKSDRARLVDLWIESALLVSRDVRLDKRHFDRTTRQNLKKMRPASAQLILSEIADRCWDSIPDIAREVHRLVSHAKAQDKFALVAPSAASAASGASGTSVSGRSASCSSTSGGLSSALPLGMPGVVTAAMGVGTGSAGGGGGSGMGAAVEVGAPGVKKRAVGGPGSRLLGGGGEVSGGSGSAVVVSALLATGRGGGAAAAAAAAATATPAGGAGGAGRYAIL